MNFNFEQKSVGETTYLVLDLEDDVAIDSFAMKMMAYNHIINIVPVQIVQINEKRQAQFNITGLTRLNNKVAVVRPKKEVLSIFSSILNAFEEVDAYMLDMDRLLLEWKYVYLDAQENCMLLYLPFAHDSGTDKFDFLQEVVSRIKPDYQEKDPYLYDILNAFSRGAVRKLSDFRELIKKSAGVLPDGHNAGYKAEEKREHKEEQITVPSQKGHAQVIRDVEIKAQKREEKAAGRPKIPVINIPGREPGTINVPSEPEPKTKEKKKEKKEEKKSIFKKSSENQRRVTITKKQKAGKIAIPGAENNLPPSSDDGHSPAENRMNSRQDEMYESYEATVIMQGSVGMKEENEETVLLEDSGYPEQTPARLVQRRSGFTYWIQGDRTTVGCGTAANIRIDNKAVSRNHAVIVRMNGKYYIEDNQSKNGSYIEGRRLQPGVREPVNNGMVIKFANEEFEFFDT